MKKLYLVLTLSIITLMVVGCDMTTEVKKSGEKTSEKTSKIKNVILIIGDGMGPAQIGLLEAYARQATNPVIRSRTTAFTRILNEGGTLGVSMTNSFNSVVTDSASSATQLATGKPANPETIGIDAIGNPSDSLIVIAKKQGKATGIVSDVRLTHSTAAAFGAHQPSRMLENEIAVDMIETGTDIMLSGGLRHWIPQSANNHESAIHNHLSLITDGAIDIQSKRKDDRNLLEEAVKKGYSLAFTKDQMVATSGKILGLFSNSAFPDAIITDRNKANPNRTIPTLREMSQKAIETLEKNEKGFFLMIESGLIDWAAHYNDTGTMLHEMLKMDDTLHYVLDWAKDRDDTLIIVTADHETGGFGFSYSSAYIPKPKALAGSAFKDKPYQPNYNYGTSQILDKIYNQKLSYLEIFKKKFDSLDKKDQTPLQLMKIVNQNTEFDITEQQAERILMTHNNIYYKKDHYSLGAKEVPKMKSNDAFFVYHISDNRQNLLAIEIAEKQSVVWSNGTHTASPVLVFASGSKKSTAPFVSFMGHPELGKKIIDVLMEK
ncbi:MAG: alkaline phosphatase [Kangiella sp.]|nr:MAG: alkaline phosphatase [Kangiella sp.]